MSVLLLRLSGPFQSWGTRSRFDERDSDLEPSKSGVIGLISAALGIAREDWKENLEPLTKLRMGVRIDKSGILKYDYHTAQEIISADESKIHSTAVTKRYYLSDATFLVGLEGEYELLTKIHSSFLNPVWALYLGRKAFVPSPGIYLKDGLIKDMYLEEALAAYPYLPTLESDEKEKIKIPEKLRYVLEAKSQEGAIRMDQLASSFAERKFVSRYVQFDSKKLGEKPSCS